MQKFAVLVVMIALAACTRSTGVLPAGPNTYSLTEHSAPILGGSDDAQKSALTKANAYCQGQGREMLPVANMPMDHSQYGDTGYTMTFRCLLPTDPEFKR
jgi:hypothetical protein